MVRIGVCLLLGGLGLQAASDAGGAALWNELAAKRAALKSFHQEFEVANQLRSRGGKQESVSQLQVDMAGPLWRETWISGAGRRQRILNSNGLHIMDDDADEYVRPKAGSGRLPDLYSAEALELKKATVRPDQSCGLKDASRLCAILDVPLKPVTRTNSPNDITRMSEGTTRFSIDRQTGLITAARSSRLFSNERRGDYISESVYVLKRMIYGGEVNAALFAIPEDAHEVKELSRWDAKRIQKSLGGKTAPELKVSTLDGRSVALSELKGKTVLLDFWTTWCPPCRADAPVIDKLYRKYGGKSLEVLSLSVNEARDVVEKYLKEHPHAYPTALSAENDLPRPYQIGVFPTYIVIAEDGTLASATQGSQGWGELKGMLKKAGMDPE